LCISQYHYRFSRISFLFWLKLRFWKLHTTILIHRLIEWSLLYKMLHWCKHFLWIYADNYSLVANLTSKRLGVIYSERPSNSDSNWRLFILLNDVWMLKKWAKITIKVCELNDPYSGLFWFFREYSLCKSMRSYEKLLNIYFERAWNADSRGLIFILGIRLYMGEN